MVKSVGDNGTGNKSILSKFFTMLCRQRFDKEGTIARDQFGSSAMILLILL